MSKFQQQRQQQKAQMPNPQALFEERGPSPIHEERARKSGYQIIAGVDEAGRGPLAGPVVAASCFFTADISISGINDSKLLTPSKRQNIYQKLIASKQVYFGLSIVDHTIIDKINIYQATLRAMIEAVDNLKKKPDYLLVDGPVMPHPTIPGEAIVKGDQLSRLIAAASIIAKETRDALMMRYHEEWPEYGFDRHKGYGTQEHREAIVKYGPCPIHRRSFEPVKSM